ncbi:MAG: WG repeat-containing protein [Chitinophagaceae bacterium]|nr:WG repeat-containing protein [Chitinophagaceae bacterium]
MAKIKINNKYGFINKDGVIEIPCSFDEVESFSDGLAKIKNK